jgi:hypothetical protein
MFNPNLLQQRVAILDNASGAGASKGVACNGHRKLTVQAVGGATATFAIEATTQEVDAKNIAITDDAATWAPLLLTNLASGATAANISDQNIYSVDVGGLSRVRVNVSSFTAGSTDPKGLTVIFVLE